MFAMFLQSCFTTKCLYTYIYIEHLSIYIFVFADVEIKLDEEGYVLPASHNEEIYKRYMMP